MAAGRAWLSLIRSASVTSHEAGGRAADHSTIQVLQYQYTSTRCTFAVTLYLYSCTHVTLIAHLFQFCSVVIIIIYIVFYYSCVVIFIETLTPSFSSGLIQMYKYII